MPIVKVRYFAALRESAGVGQESIVTSALTLGELYAELAQRHRFNLSEDQVKASQNGDWSDLSLALSEGDEIVFIPPVAGG